MWQTDGQIPHDGKDRATLWKRRAGKSSRERRVRNLKNRSIVREASTVDHGSWWDWAWVWSVRERESVERVSDWLQKWLKWKRLETERIWTNDFFVSRFIKCHNASINSSAVYKLYYRNALRCGCRFVWSSGRFIMPVEQRMKYGNSLSSMTSPLYHFITSFPASYDTSHEHRSCTESGINVTRSSADADKPARRF